MRNQEDTSMIDNYRLAQLIIACWKIAGDASRIPTSHGILDRALKTVVDKGGFPQWARERLHFVDSRIGLQCAELPAILEWAQRAQLTTAPNPSYETTEVQVSNRVARSLLLDLDIAEASASAWGLDLRKAIDDARSDLAAVDHASIEDY